MTEVERLKAILKTLDKLSIRGSDDVQTMYSLIGFIYQEIKTIEEKEKAPPVKEG